MVRHECECRHLRAFQTGCRDDGAVQMVQLHRSCQFPNSQLPTQLPFPISYATLQPQPERIICISQPVKKGEESVDGSLKLGL